jgi:Zn-dependent protease
VDFNPQFLYEASTWILPVLLAIPFHEASHGYVAHLLGDDTAWRQGRVTFNPLKHIDPVGTILLPLILLIVRSPFLFGFAKPVPVNFRALRNPRFGSVLVAAAGPAMNIALAFIAAWLFYGVLVLAGGAQRWILETLRNVIELNVVLAAFNMLPIPPLDGGRVAVGLLPRGLAMPLARIEPLGIPIIFLLLVVLPSVAKGFDPLRWLLEWPVSMMLELIMTVTGIPNIFGTE